jgi:hypothetical protein
MKPISPAARHLEEHILRLIHSSDGYNEHISDVCTA